MTITQALTQADTNLAHLQDHTTIVRQLLANTCKLSQEQLWTNLNKEITPQQLRQFEQLVSRAAEHAPLAYLLGYKEFFGRKFIVTPDTLIPRPESEQLIHLTLNHLNQLHPTSNILPPTIIDVGTGSGCLAITIALELPQASVIAIDTSKAALTVARRNAQALKTTNVTFVQGSLLGPLSYMLQPHSCDVIVANLPYISNQEYQDLPLNVRKYEPKQALVSGAHPDTFNQQLVIQAKDHRKPKSLLAYETTNGQIVVVE